VTAFVNKSLCKGDQAEGSGLYCVPETRKAVGGRLSLRRAQADREKAAAADAAQRAREQAAAAARRAADEAAAAQAGAAAAAADAAARFQAGLEAKRARLAAEPPAGAPGAVDVLVRLPGGGRASRRRGPAAAGSGVM